MRAQPEAPLPLLNGGLQAFRGVAKATSQFGSSRKLLDGMQVKWNWQVPSILESRSVTSVPAPSSHTSLDVLSYSRAPKILLKAKIQKLAGDVKLTSG